MTKLVDNMLEKISTLSEIEQNIIARNIIEEIEQEKIWSKTFANSEDSLESLALEALEEFEKNPQPLDIEKL